jgi:imidazolonepropionase-like amidohydrolase
MGKGTMPRILLKNANVVLEGQEELETGLNVLVEADRIAAVTREPVEPGDARVIDLAGKTLMPGLIDAHAHITGLSLSPKNLAYPPADIALAAADYLRNCLMAGFTTIREAGGADYAIAHLLAQGALVGPRMFYSGRALTLAV